MITKAEYDLFIEQRASLEGMENKILARANVLAPRWVDAAGDPEQGERASHELRVEFSGADLRLDITEPWRDGETVYMDFPTELLFMEEAELQAYCEEAQTNRLTAKKLKEEAIKSAKLEEMKTRELKTLRELLAKYKDEI